MNKTNEKNLNKMLNINIYVLPFKNPLVLYYLILPWPH